MGKEGDKADFSVPSLQLLLLSPPCLPLPLLGLGETGGKEDTEGDMDNGLTGTLLAVTFSIWDAEVGSEQPPITGTSHLQFPLPM